MGKEKKKSDWDDLQDLLSSSEIANDWDAPASNDEDVETPVAKDAAASVEEETNESNADAPVAKKTSVKGKRTTSGEKKAKSTKSRKKTAPKNADAIAVALENAPNADESPETETLDVAIGDSEETTKKRRRPTSKKAERSEGGLIENVLQLEKETKAKKRSRAKELDENPFVGLLSQIGRIADSDLETTEGAPKEAKKTTKNAEVAVEIAEPAVSFERPLADEDAPQDDAFSFDNFFADSNVPELDISWGKPARVEKETSAAPETPLESAPAAQIESKPREVESVEVAPNDGEREKSRDERRPRRDERERRGNRRDRDSRRRREYEAEPAAVEPTPKDDAPVSVDLNDLDAFFAAPEIEIVGFAPAREKKDAAPRENVAEKAPEKRERTERTERAPFESPLDGDDESDERSRRRRRRRRGDRRDESNASSRPFDDKIQDEDVATNTANDVGIVVEQERDSEIRRERRRDERVERRDDRREERRERRPRRENDAPNAVETTPEEGRADARQRVLPSWSDAISYVVRFNMNRRVNRRKN